MLTDGIPFPTNECKPGRVIGRCRGCYADVVIAEDWRVARCRCSEWEWAPMPKPEPTPQPRAGPAEANPPPLGPLPVKPAKKRDFVEELVGESIRAHLRERWKNPLPDGCSWTKIPGLDHYETTEIDALYDLAPEHFRPLRL